MPGINAPHSGGIIVKLGLIGYFPHLKPNGSHPLSMQTKGSIRNFARPVGKKRAKWLAPFLLAGGLLWGQADTEVYLADLLAGDAGLSLSAFVNVSDNPGYDNQPAFLDDASLLYSRTRAGQTDIALYSLRDGTTTWVSNTPGGSEYSPLKIPGEAAVSAIRLDTSGLQRLYRYPLPGGEPSLVAEDLKIGYQLWYDAGLLICTVLVEDRMDLVFVYPGEGTQQTIHRDVGRSLQRIPGTGRFSFTAREGDLLLLKSMDPHARDLGSVIALPEGVQDVCWVSDSLLLCGQGDAVLHYRAGGAEGWEPLGSFPGKGVKISRMAYEPEHGRLALVIESED